MKTLKKSLALLLAIVMAFTVIPTAAFASLAENSPEYNEGILRALEDVIGSEDEAKLYYSVLEQYGLLDDDGSFVDDLHATIDGVEYTKEELLALLSGDYEGDKLAYVDGMAITLDNLWNIIVIEGYLDYLRENYYLDGEWSAEQEANYADFLEQFTSEGVYMTLATDPQLEGDYSGLNHGAAVSLTASAPVNGVVTVTASLVAAKEGQKVSFKYEAISGSTKVEAASGTVDLTADANGEDSDTFTVTLVPETIDTLIADAPVWYLNVSELTNAVFGASGRNAATVSFPGESTVGSGKEIDKIYGGFDYYVKSPCDLTLTSGELYAINHGIVTKLEEVKLPSITPDPMPQSTNPSSLKKIDVSYSMTADGGSTKFYSNAVTVKLENPPGPTIMYIPTVVFPANYVKSVELPRNIQNYIHCEYSTPLSSFSGHFVFSDTTAPTVKSIYTPEKSYTVGQTVPIVVEFSEPMKAENAFIIVNGIQVFAWETGSSDRLTFPYPVQTLDSAHPVVTEVHGTDASEKNVIAYDYKPSSESEDGSLVLSAATMTSCLPEDSIADFSCEIDYSVPAAPVLTATITLADSDELTAWLVSALDENKVCSALCAAVKGFDKVPFTLQSDTAAGGKMTASFTLEPSYTEKSFTVELYRNGALLVGTDYVERVTLAPVVLIAAGDVTVSTLVKDAGGDPYVYENAENPVIYAQDSPIISALFALEPGKSYTYADTTSVTIFGDDGKPVDSTADFAWSSSDPTVANIDKTGSVVPTGKAGEVSFTLTAFNGGGEGKAVTKTTAPLTFGVGLTPFLLIPNDAFEIVSGTDLPLFWSSNIPDKDENAEFTVTVTDDSSETVFSTTAAVCGVTIPCSALEYRYDSGATNKYTVTVSALYDGVAYSDSSVITLRSAPAVITLDTLDTYYVTDSVSSIDVYWTICSFDRYSSSGSELFRLYITKNDQPVYESGDPGSGSGGTYEGSYTLSLDDVVSDRSDPTSYRDVYTVTIQAKNGSDSTWSYDSFVLYVYDEDALKLWVNGEETDGTLTLTNIPAISEMTQDEILALKRDISLHALISANYGDYAWNEISDKLAWSSSDTAVSDLNYRQASYYASIGSYTYTSYRPTTEFMLSGLSNGTAEITETHVLTGMTESLSVTVNTLKDKLYLFSCTPAVPTVMYYVNGDGEKKTANSTDSGDFAIYEESGIDGDVYFTSTYEGHDYYGTYFSHAIQSGETDPVGLTLYPCNNLVMRRAAYASVYLKNPDGTPYTGDVIIRSGVYVNGEYVETAKFGYADGALASNSGSEDFRASTDASGKLTVIMDSTQWGLEGGLAVNDAVSYSFVVAKADATDYYPLLIEVDASQNEEAFIRSGEASASFRKNTGEGKHPFILDEKLVTANPDVGYRGVEDILDDTGCIGVSLQIPYEELSVSVMWWGAESGDESDYDMALRTEGRFEISADKKTVSADSLPFAGVAVTTITVPIDTEESAKCGIDAAPKRLELLYENTALGSAYSEELSFRIADATNDPLTTDSTTELRDNIVTTVGMSRSKDCGKINIQDDIMQLVLHFFEKKNYSPDIEHTSGFSLIITPTKDPTEFLLYLACGLSNMDSKKNVTGIYADGTADSYFSYFPGMKEVIWALTPKSEANNAKYWQKYNDELNSVENGEPQLDVFYNLSGYLEGKLTRNPLTHKWDIHVLGGGFDVGGGAGFAQYINTMVGYVPVTAELRGGGTINVSLDTISMQYLNENNEFETGNEFLTKLRIYIYLKFFGGLGWDYSVIAIKIGLYGQINSDLTCAWYNRPDMPENARYADGKPIPSHDEVLDGQYLKVSGQVGIEFVLKIWFFSYEKAIFSLPFDGGDADWGDWKQINELWEISRSSFVSTQLALMSAGVAEPFGEGSFILDLAPTVPSFDYLNNGVERTWNSRTLPSLRTQALGAVIDRSVTKMQTNANPYTSPVLSDDGSILVYLSDGDDSDGDAVHTAYAVRGVSGYDDCDFITGLGSGDSGNTVAGTSDFAVAAWSTLGDAYAKDAGSVLTPEDQILMLDSSEIYASIYSEGAWSTEQLTDNLTADISPVVAVSGNRAIAAWRSVATTNVNGNIADFNACDNILFRVYDGSDWSDTQTLYNGTSGNVKALNAAMLPDGTAAVIYVLDTDGEDATSADREILWSVVDPHNEVIRTVRATNDTVSDENPQITATNIGGTPCFAAAWYSSETVGDELKYDIHMADISNGGVILGRLPQSLEREINERELLVTSDFRFAKNSDSARNIDDLALVWIERRTNDADTDGLTVEYDVLNSMKFYTYGEDAQLVGLTAPQEIAAAPESTLFDSFDIAYNFGIATAVILGTEYDPEHTQEKTGTSANGASVSYSVPKSTSYLFTASGTYADSISVHQLYLDLGSLRCGANTTVGFTVMNDGISPVTRLTVDLGGTETTVTGLNLLPGDSITVYVDYSVPTDTVRDEAYTVTARTAAGSTCEASGTAEFAQLDLEITSAQIVAESEGKRTIELKLYNNSDAKLALSGRSVAVSFYTDQTLEDPVPGLGTVVITDASELKMIDEGGFTRQIVFDAEAYLATLDSEPEEIPEPGIPLFIRVCALDENGVECPDSNSESNTASVVCENLTVRTGTEVSVKSALSTENSVSTVTAELRNNRLSETTTGNVIVTLFDEDGGIVEQRQSYDSAVGDSSLLSIGGEATKRVSFTFDKPGSYAEVLYTSAILDDNDASLSTLDATNVPGVNLSAFEQSAEDENTFTLDLTLTDVGSLNFVITPSDPDATVTLRGETLAGFAEVPLSLGENTIDFTVTAQDGVTVRHYVLNVIAQVTYEDYDEPEQKPAPVCKHDEKCPLHKFTDLDLNEWYHDGVHFCVDNGLMIGTSDTTFSPDELTTRGQLVTILYRLEGEPALTNSNVFEDVEAGSWYENGVVWAQGNGIVNGYGDGNFGPEDPITREQAAVILRNYAAYKGVKTAADEDTDLTVFGDWQDISDYALDAIRWAVSGGLMQGDGFNLNPQSSTIRVEMAALLQRFCENILAGK